MEASSALIFCLSETMAYLQQAEGVCSPLSKAPVSASLADSTQPKLVPKSVTTKIASKYEPW